MCVSAASIKAVIMDTRGSDAVSFGSGLIALLMLVCWQDSHDLYVLT